jgi:hypothetical protein
MNKFNKRITITCLVIVMLFTACFCRSVSKTSKNDDFKAVALMISYPYINGQTGNVTDLRDTIRIYYSKNLICYKLPSVKKFETNETIQNSNSYFVFEQGDSTGYFFTTDTTGKKISVDSFLKAKGFLTNFELPQQDTWSMAEKKSSRSYEQIFYSEKNLGENVPDSLCYYFDERFNDLNYSFSKKLDSLKGMKFYKFRIVYNAEFSGKLKIRNRAYLFEIQPDDVTDKHKIVALFEKFKSIQHR